MIVDSVSNEFVAVDTVKFAPATPEVAVFVPPDPRVAAAVVADAVYRTLPLDAANVDDGWPIDKFENAVLVTNVGNPDPFENVTISDDEADPEAEDKTGKEDEEGVRVCQPRHG